ncbi:MAG: hypothetical protein IT215_00790, partial [Chitinophagaceae bacterium]|nr:hypothetical protein [Chitinophagaceae bacterium]
TEKFGKNIISFIPFKLIELNNNSYSNDYTPLSVGLSYERIFENQFISFQFPVTFSLDRVGFFVTPAVKLYPKKQGIVKFAVGPQLLISIEDGTYQKYIQTPNGGYYQMINEVRKTFGFGINNSVNFTINKSFYLGVDATLGVNYYDSYNKKNVYSTSYNNNSMNILVGLGFNIGYRF